MPGIELTLCVAKTIMQTRRKNRRGQLPKLGPQCATEDLIASKLRQVLPGRNTRTPRFCFLRESGKNRKSMKPRTKKQQQRNMPTQLHNDFTVALFETQLGLESAFQPKPRKYLLRHSLIAVDPPANSLTFWGFSGKTLDFATS